MPAQNDLKERDLNNFTKHAIDVIDKKKTKTNLQPIKIKCHEKKRGACRMGYRL